MKNYRLGFIGCGNMAGAVIRALDNREKSGANEAGQMRFSIGVSDSAEDKLESVKAYAELTTTDNAKLAAWSDFVLLAVKPQSAAQALTGLDFSGKIVLSIMAGVSLKKLSDLTRGTKLVRVMPNLNARIGLSYNAYCCEGLSEAEEAVVRRILSSFGTEKKVDESRLNAVTGLTGSAPAFVFQFIEAIVEAGISNGFDPVTARQMALSTVIGSAKLVEYEAETPLQQLIDSVCSKGGTTIEGVRYLRRQKLKETVTTAVQKSIDRAGELESSL